MSVHFKDNSREVFSKFEANIDAAMDAIGIKAVNLILWQMRQGYGKPIRKKGDLQRDVSFDHVEKRTINVGNTLKYSLFVHEGTRKMGKRPYIKDAIMSRDNVKKLMKVAHEQLYKGFENP